MNTKHTPTPGPWILEMPPEGEWTSRSAYVRAKSWGVVADLNLTPSMPHFDGPQRANARLIAAAPELIEAARAAEAVLARQKWIEGSTDPEAVALFKLRAAIAKATGGAS